MVKNGTVKELSERLLDSRLVGTGQLAEAILAVGEEEDPLLAHLVEKNLLTSFQARQLRAGVQGFHVGNYVVIDYLGRGGNSLVFKAQHTLMPQRYVALKTLETRNLHHRDDALARFRREIEILALLDHPNIVRAYDVLPTRTELFLVLEFIDGSDLGKLVRRRGPLPVPEAVGYGMQAARGLAYAHRADIIHRDFKPANLLLAQDGVIKLSDLGLARMLAHELDSERTLKGKSLGTPEFMAPEQAEDATRADRRSDLYSLGATLFYLLSGELPVHGSNYLHCLQQLLTQPPRSLGEVRPDLPPGLVAVVDRLRARAPAERPASAEEAILLLEPFACSEDGKKSSRWLRRNEPSAETLRDLHAKIGAQAMEIERLKKQLEALRLERSHQARARTQEPGGMGQELGLRCNGSGVGTQE